MPINDHHALGVALAICKQIFGGCILISGKLAHNHVVKGTTSQPSVANRKFFVRVFGCERSHASNLKKAQHTEMQCAALKCVGHKNGPVFLGLQGIEEYCFQQHELFLKKKPLVATVFINVDE
jgi:hypothetical protein